MRRLGYQWLDLLRVYALNLILVPVNLGGVAKSLQQAVTGRKTPFGRTPKVLSRTAAPSLYVLLVVGLFVYCLGSSVFDLALERWVHAAFALINGLFFGYAIVALIGLNEATEDLLEPLRVAQNRRRFWPVRQPPPREGSVRPTDAGRRVAVHQTASSGKIHLGGPVSKPRYTIQLIAALFGSIST